MFPHIQSDVSLAPFNTFRIAARARRFVRVESLDALREVREQPAWSDGPRLVLGGGSNVVFTRDFDGLVVQVASHGVRHLGDDGDAHLVEAAAGEDWDGFVRTTVRSGWPGLENLALIPGSCGAAPVQNIGAYGVELDERFAWLDAFDVGDGTVRRMDAAACGFGYRDSVFKGALRDRTIIVNVVFRLPMRWAARRDYADVDALLRERALHDPTPADLVDVVTAIRRAKLPDPRVLGNAGSFFKNPVVTREQHDAMKAIDEGVVGHVQPDGRYKLAAAWLIDRCGWRGRSLPGGSDRAAVHDRQALVLVNRGDASGADVLALASAIQDSVATRFGVTLEPEPLIV